MSLLGVSFEVRSWCWGSVYATVLLVWRFWLWRVIVGLVFILLIAVCCSFSSSSFHSLGCILVVLVDSVGGRFIGFGLLWSCRFIVFRPCLFGVCLWFFPVRSLAGILFGVVWVDRVRSLSLLYRSVRDLICSFLESTRRRILVFYRIRIRRVQELCCGLDCPLA